MDGTVNVFLTLREQRGLKILSGMRGAGKTAHLLGFRDILLSEGVEPARILYLDAESPAMRRIATGEQLVNHVEDSLPRDGTSFVLIREANALADAAIAIGVLSASSRYDIYMTLSTRQVLSGGLGKYLAGTHSILELPPPDFGPMTVERAHALWNEIFIKDVLAPQHILDVSLVDRIAGFLSDHLGDPVSLRQIGAAVSPSGRLISPHTVSTYLDALADAFLVEKAFRFDLAEDAPQSTRYSYFFTNLALRDATFGAAPEREAERTRLNDAWIRLRREHGKTYTVAGSSATGFVTLSGTGEKTFWRGDETGLRPVAAADIIGG